MNSVNQSSTRCIRIRPSLITTLRTTEELKTFNSLNAHYGDSFDTFTRNELYAQDYFPDSRPELYLRRRVPTTQPNEFMLFMINDVQLFLVKKKMKNWLSHYEEKGWDCDYPTILLVCITASVARRVGEYLLDLGLDVELHILLTTKEAVLGGKSKIWIDYQIEESLLNLT